MWICVGCVCLLNSDLSIKKNILIAAIIRNNEVIIPSGMDYISLDDKVIVVTTNQFLNDLNEILE